MNDKKYMLNLVNRLNECIPDLIIQYKKCMPTYTPPHDGFKNNLIMKLQRSAENIKAYSNGEEYNVGEWYFDTLDLVNALTLLEVMKQSEESYKLIEEVCKVLCEEYDKATESIPQLKE